MYHFIEKYLNNQIIVNTINNYRSIWEKYNGHYPYLNYFGLNFDNEKLVSVKFYFHVAQKLSKDELSLFLPEEGIHHLSKYYDYYEPPIAFNSKNAGVALEVKFKSEDFEPTYGFHLRLKASEESYRLIGNPKLLPLNLLELNENPGINYEYTKNFTLRKKYYYFNSIDNKNYFSNRFNINFLRCVDMIEYSESDYFSKINAWISDTELSKKINPLIGVAENSINKFNEDLNLRNNLFGFYENKTTKAIYFILNKRMNQLYIDTLENIILKK